MNASTWLLTRRTLIQFPRNPMVLGFSIPPVLMMFVVFGALFEGVKHLPGFPTDNYFEYLAPAAVLMTTVPGIANAAVGLASDFQSRYLQKLLTMPVSIGSIMAGRLIADGARLFVQGGAVLLLAVALGAQVATGLAGALLMLLIGTLFAIVTFGVLTANLALKTKDPAGGPGDVPDGLHADLPDHRLPDRGAGPERRAAGRDRREPDRVRAAGHARADAHGLRLAGDRARLPGHRRPRSWSGCR